MAWPVHFNVLWQPLVCSVLGRRLLGRLGLGRLGLGRLGLGRLGLGRLGLGRLGLRRLGLGRLRLGRLRPVWQRFSLSSSDKSRGAAVELQRPAMLARSPKIE